jgi:hypothetical protein
MAETEYENGVIRPKTSVHFFPYRLSAWLSAGCSQWIEKARPKKERNNLHYLSITTVQPTVYFYLYFDNCDFALLARNRTKISKDDSGERG